MARERIADGQTEQSPPCHILFDLSIKDDRGYSSAGGLQVERRDQLPPGAKNIMEVREGEELFIRWAFTGKREWPVRVRHIHGQTSKEDFEGFPWSAIKEVPLGLIPAILWRIKHPLPDYD